MFPEKPVVYIAPRGYENELASELSVLGISVFEQRGRLFLCEAGGNASRPVWAQNIWLNPELVPIVSINQAARSLKSIQRNWACHPTGYFRRSALIQEKLPKVSAKPLCFGSALPKAPLGAWSLWQEDMLLAASLCSSPFADGEVCFEENKNDPPGRAYLKLWEALTLAGKFPGENDVCLDLGSSPGGWSWVLASLGAKVISVDKAPLAENVAKMDGVRFVRGSAFALDPSDFREAGWFCSDVICYPGRLYQLVMQWLESGFEGNVICTLKFQGATDFEVIRKFQGIPGGRLLHLSHNKHELTWMRIV